MDFGERLTVISGEVSLLDILASHFVFMLNAPLARLASDKTARPASGDGDGFIDKDRSLSEFNVLRARNRSSERMHIALRIRMTTGGGVSSWGVRNCDDLSWTDRRVSR